MNNVNPQENIPEVEKNNRVIKENFRVVFHSLPFKKIPKIMVQILTMDCAKKFNFYPARGVISPYCSPRMILHQKPEPDPKCPASKSIRLSIFTLRRQ
jgi:hypothetical protein